MSIRSMSEEVLHEILARSNTPEFPIGLKDVDDVLWGLKRGKIHCVGGRTSMGKSSFMFFIANTLLKSGKKVGFLNLEMTNKEILERMFCMDLNIDNENMIKGKLTVADRYALEEYIGSMPEKHGLYVADRLDADWGNIMNIRHFLETNKVDCLFLDYIQMIRAVENQQERIQLGQFSVDLDRLAKEFNIPIVYGSQINRAGVTDENSGIPKLSNMKGCVDGDTLIYDSNPSQKGYYKIKGLFKKQKKPLLWSYDVNSKGFTKKYPVTIIDSGIKECLRITTESGKSIIVSTDTKFVCDGSWVKSRDIRVGDEIVVAPKKHYDITQKGWNKGTKGLCKSNSGSFKKGLIPWNKGLKRIGFIPANKGCNKNMAISKRIRISMEYVEWRRRVFSRDDFTCQRCRLKGGELHAHHKKGFWELIDEAISRCVDGSKYECCMTYLPLWDIDNGITLCKACHKKTKHSWGLTRCRKK